MSDKQFGALVAGVVVIAGMLIFRKPVSSAIEKFPAMIENTFSKALEKMQDIVININPPGVPPETPEPDNIIDISPEPEKENPFGQNA